MRSATAAGAAVLALAVGTTLLTTHKQGANGRRDGAGGGGRSGHAACAARRGGGPAHSAERSSGGGAGGCGAVAWSPAATLASCSSPGAPQVAFPTMTPFRRTGAGAVAFASAARCPAGAGLQVADISAGDSPAPPQPARTAEGRPVGLAGATAAAATARGQILVVGPAPGARGAAAFSEGGASGPFAAARSLGGPLAPLGLATAYRGDVALASERTSQPAAVQLRMQPYFARGLAPVAALGAAPGSRRALAVALDYRTDALAVWWQDGWLFARERHADGAIGSLQRFAPAGAHVQLAAVISDDDRAIVAWVDPRSDGADLYLDVSASGMRLGRGKLVERLRWRAGRRLPPGGAVRLVRLSTEAVLMAWTGTSDRHFVVRAAGVDIAGVRTTSTLSAAGEDATLEDLATGPRGDALALWRATPVAGAGGGARPGGSASSPPPRPRGAVADGTIAAAWGVPSTTGVPRMGPPQQIARPGPHEGATVAIDPASDRAVASWRDAGGAIRYAVGEPRR